MRAIIFAAGLGTRLQQFTANLPKALVEVNGKPLLQHSIEKLRSAGVEHLIINVHHYASAIIDFLESRKNFGLHIEISDEREELLDTGGGLLKASHFFPGDEPFWACNTDVISNIDLQAMMAHHRASSALATLAVRQRETSRYFLFDSSMTLSGWENRKQGEKRISRDSKPLTSLAFSGIQIIQPDFFKQCPYSGKFSITNAWIELAKTQIIKGYCHDKDFWFDLGTPENLAKAETFLRSHTETA